MIDNNENGNMPKLTIALSEEAKEKLKRMATKNLRSLSKQVEYLIQESEE